MRLAAVAAVLSAIAAASSAAQPQSPSLAITNVALIAMIDDTIALPDRTIVVSGDRISAVGPSATVAVPRAARVIDGRGKYLIPGLSDMHVHLEYFDKPDILDLFIANGVTTVRNMDGRPYLLDWKKQTAAGVVTGPRIYTAGPLLDGNPPVRPDNTVVETATAARAAVEVQAAANYDFVKVYSGLSADAFAAIVATAREKRLSVAGHVPRAVGLDAVLASGLRSIEHLADYSRAVEAKNDVPVWSKRYLSMPVDPERITSLARRVANAGVWSVPTLIQPQRELLRPEQIDDRLKLAEVRLMPEDGRKQWEAQARRVAARMDEDDWKLVSAGRAHRLMLVDAFHKAGVRLLAGTDTPNPFVVPGFSLHDELALLVEAGLSPAAALAAATREAARFLEASDWGTIAAGKAADLVLLDANPLDDIHNTRRIAKVILRGRAIDR
jgi:imidazolonepropionase-like amidohydrolase